MSRLVFVNLAIDQIWDKKQSLAQIFPARLPVSEFLIRTNENLGVFLSAPGDAVLALKVVDGFAEFLAARNCLCGELLPIAANPFDQKDWLTEVAKKLGERPRAKTHPFTTLVAVSRSPLEQRLQAEYVASPPDRAISPERLAELNNKRLLVNFAREGLIEIPPTRMLNQSELRALPSGPPGKPSLFKHEFGSGGGGNFTSEQWPLLQRRLPDDDESVWFIQERIEASQEGCVFGTSEISGPADLCEVLYTPQGLSYKHQFSDSFSDVVKAEVQATYQRIRARLTEEGYVGPIGIDFLVSREDKKVFFVDLNLRLTKTHLLLSALQKLRVEAKRFSSYRYRWNSKRTFTFAALWDDLRRELRLNARGEGDDGLVILPYSVAGVESPGSLKEISFFYSAGRTQEKTVETALLKITKDSL